MRYFNQAMVTTQPETPLLYGWVSPDVQETEVQSSFPRADVICLYSEDLVLSRLEGNRSSVMEISSAKPEMWEFSREARVLFYFGCAFLVSSFALMILGPFIFSEGWTGLVVGVVLVVTGITFRFCLVYSFRDAAERCKKFPPVHP